MKLLKKLLFIVIYFVPLAVHSQDTKLLPKLFKGEKLVEDIISNLEIYEVQIIYTKIERNKNKVNFKNYHFNVDKNNYFYPSTAVMLPAAVLTLEKLNNIAKENHEINKDRWIKIEKAESNQEIVLQATLSEYIKSMLLERDENAYNYCYDFLNQRYFNERMHELGYKDSWFLHKLDNEDTKESRLTNRITFYRNDIQSYYYDIIHLKRHASIIPFFGIYTKNEEYNTVDYYSNRKKLHLGKGYIEDGKQINSPLDFTNKNSYTVENYHSFLKALIFPETQKYKLNLTNEDYRFLYKYMSAADDSSDNFHKYIMGNNLNSSIKTFNISGRDFGFMADNAYVIDTENNIEFLLTIVINCNEENIFGENYKEEHYKYETVGLPFIKEVSSIIHKYEIKNKNKRNIPDFSNVLD